MRRLIKKERLKRKIEKMNKLIIPGHKYEAHEAGSWWTEAGDDIS